MKKTMLSLSVETIIKRMRDRIDTIEDKKDFIVVYILDYCSLLLPRLYSFACQSSL